MSNTHLETAVFAGGCFWCTEAVFTSLKGVISVLSGYTGGQMTRPSYEDVSSGVTGHAEAVMITFDPTIISYNDLLIVFFNTHDPTSLNKQGNDIGTNYRSAIYYTNSTQEQSACNLIRELEESKAYDLPIMTEIVPLMEFYPAEEYHRNYYINHSTDSYCKLIIAPKLAKMQTKFRELLIK